MQLTGQGNQYFSIFVRSLIFKAAWMVVKRTLTSIHFQEEHPWVL